MLVEEADYLSHLYRWTLMTGEVPRAQDWLKREDWPHPDHVIDVFGSWEKFLSHAELPSSPLLAKVREAEATRRDLAAREKAIEREAGRAEDLRRQVETARRRREAAEAERDEAARRAARADRALGRPRSVPPGRRPGWPSGGRPPRRRRRRRPGRAPTHGPRPPRTGPRPWPTSSRRSARTARSSCGAWRSSRRAPRATAGPWPACPRCSPRRHRRGGALAEALPPPATVLEAVQRAADAGSTWSSPPTPSRARPTRRSAGRPRCSRPWRRSTPSRAASPPGRWGVSLVQAASEAGLTYKQGVSEIARSATAPLHRHLGGPPARPGAARRARVGIGRRLHRPHLPPRGRRHGRGPARAVRRTRRPPPPDTTT
jgi:hypothetical protein